MKGEKGYIKDLQSSFFNFNLHLKRYKLEP